MTLTFEEALEAYVLKKAHEIPDRDSLRCQMHTEEGPYNSEFTADYECVIWIRYTVGGEYRPGIRVTGDLGGFITELAGFSDAA